MIISRTSEHENRLLLKNLGDIRALLGKLQKRRSRITAHFESSGNTFSTCVLHINESLIILDNTCDQVLAERILASNKLMFSTVCSGAPVSFVATHIEPCVFDGLSAFTISIPNTIYWIQRRQFARLRESQADVTCNIALENGDITVGKLADICLGGIGFLSAQTSPSFKTGTLLNKCKLELPEVGKLSLQIRVCSSNHITLENGTPATRYGCEFVNMRDLERSQIQHYISQRETSQNVYATLEARP